MKLFPADIAIEDFDLDEVSIGFKGKKRELNKTQIKPADIDFEYQIRKKRTKNTYRINFHLSIEKDEKISVSLKGHATYSFPEDFSPDKVDAFLFGNVIPSIYISLRGILFLLTYNSPKRILLPIVNFLKSYQAAQETS